MSRPRRCIIRAATVLIGCGGVAHACSFAGATQIFPADLSPPEFLKMVSEHGVSLVSLIPTMLAGMMEAPNVSDAFRAVRTIVYGAAPISEALLLGL